jgi:hypothetical protein
MDVSINVRGVAAVKKALAQLPINLRDKALAPALNKVAAKARTETIRAITSEYAIGREDVVNALSTRPARVKVTGQVSATLTIYGNARRRGRSFNAIRFLEKSITLAEARRRRKAGALSVEGRGGRALPILGFKFKRGGGIKRIKGAFIGNNGRTVFARTGSARTPIEPVQLIGVSQMFNARKVKSRVLERIQKELPIEVERAVRLVQSRFGK